MIIHKESASLLRTEKMEKLPMGPTSPKPGPQFPRQVTTAVTVVVKEKLSMDTSKIPQAKVKR